MRIARFSVLALFIAVSMASAGVIFSTDQIASATNPAAVGTTATLGPGGAVGGIGGPIAFTMPFSGLFKMTVQDCCLVGDVYEAIVDGTSLGLTAAVPIGGPTHSMGVFSLPLAAGAHTYDITDVVLSYLGVASPYGGGVVGDIYSPAGLTVTGEAVPEPATVSMMIGAGLLLFGLRRRR